jgi:hypothetical protein
VRRLRRALSAHPLRTAGAAAVIIVGLPVAWYLGSPLFIRTTLVEDLPAAASTAAPTQAATAVPTAAAPTVLSRGRLGYVDPLHNGTGEVRLVRLRPDQHVVRFEEVAITNAPDIHVYLSRDTGGRYAPENTVYLGPLKATNGSFNYDVPAGTDLAPYRSVVVWCRAFAVLITWADLAA